MSTQKRNIWLDNVKGFLIICVVAGHFLESGIDYHSNMCKSLFLFIYSFHMPLFVFASMRFRQRNASAKNLRILQVCMSC